MNIRQTVVLIGVVLTSVLVGFNSFIEAMQSALN